MRRTDLPPHKTATYVLPHWKAVYVSVPKAACTSLKWLVADLQGESREHFHQALSREVGRNMTVHHRKRWQHTPMLPDLSDKELAEITPENGWFVFAVVRHPSARLWSGWQSKFLMKDPRFFKLYPDAPWPKVPTSTADVVEGFQAFTRALTDDPRPSIFKDRHFLPQSRLLNIDHTPYSRVYRTNEIPQLLDDLEKHLRPLGLDRMPELLTSNETPLRPVESAFSDEVKAIVGAHYATDFERFDYPDVVPDSLEKSGSYSTAALAEIGRLVERNERIGDLADIAIDLRDGSKRASRKLAAVEQHRPPSTFMPIARRVARGSRRRAAAQVRKLKGRLPSATRPGAEAR